MRMILFFSTTFAKALEFKGAEILDGVVIELSSFDTALSKQIRSEARPLGKDFFLQSTSSPEAALELFLQLEGAPSIRSVWPDVLIPHVRSYNDPLYEGQWYLEQLNMTLLFERTEGDPAITIAVIDSGIDIAHPDLADKLISPYDAYDEDDDPSPNPGEFCWEGAESELCDSHGTAVAGITVATANNEEGMVGLCPECSLLPIKMLGAQNRLSTDIRAFTHAIDQEAAVINNSWGYSEAMEVPAPLKNVIIQAATEGWNGLGAVVVFAAGNEDRELQDNELCAIEELICVSATDSYGRPTNYTNYGNAIDISAPSATVSIAPENSTTTNFGGTSAAAPVVSGVAGWARSARPELSSSELKAVLIEASVPSPLVTHNEDGHHPYYGFGTLSPEKLDRLLFPEAEEDDKTEKEPRGSCSHHQNHFYWIVLPFLLWRRR
jgi:serine protease